jgi:hypothetical protein
MPISCMDISMDGRPVEEWAASDDSRHYGRWMQDAGFIAHSKFILLPLPTSLATGRSQISELFSVRENVVGPRSYYARTPVSRWAMHTSSVFSN